jgi:hypothetical protein
MVTGVIRTYTGRHLSFADYAETYTDVVDEKLERYLIEVPVERLLPPVVRRIRGRNVVEVMNNVQLMNRNTGRIVMMAGPSVTVTYKGGYSALPQDLAGVFLELVRQQMSFWGHDNLGTMQGSGVPMEKAVTIGSLRVEYAVAATTSMAKASSGGALSVDGLAPYSMILDNYRSYRRLIAT